jgi:tryptophan halogenase
MRTIKIVGAGTAGLVTALILKQGYPEYNIEVIQSGKIGIIGVGEGSTEHWKMFVDYCGINSLRAVRETDGAMKKGIKFENWNGDGESYFHSLSDPFWTEYQSDPTQRMLFIKSLVVSGIKTQDVLVDTNLVSQRDGLMATNQYHFNTFKLNNFLKTICSEKNISVIDATIVDLSLKENGDIESVLDDTGNKHFADIFIDSTGFKRVLSSKQDVKWVSYKKYLPMNHALAFPTDDVSDLKPYTLSRALSSGWNWRISTQERYGNGYVFCDDFIDSTKAHDEIQSVYSEKVQVAKDIKFDAGRVDKFWVNNCISVGLSASFVEPLEASSIGNTILQAFGLVKLIPLWDLDKKKAEDAYNTKFIKCFDNIVDFVQLHYITKRNDSPFWKELPTMMVKTDFIEQHLENFKKTLPLQMYFVSDSNMFQAANWAQVMHGLKLYDEDYIRKTLAETTGDNCYNIMQSMYNEYLDNVQRGSYMEHKVLLEQNRIVVKLDR